MYTKFEIIQSILPSIIVCSRQTYRRMSGYNSTGSFKIPKFLFRIRNYTPFPSENEGVSHLLQSNLNNSNESPKTPYVYEYFLGHFKLYFLPKCIPPFQSTPRISYISCCTLNCRNQFLMKSKNVSTPYFTQTTCEWSDGRSVVLDG